MKKAIKPNTPFYFVFNNQKYMGVITGDMITKIFMLNLHQVRETRFLFWKYETTKELYTSYKRTALIEHESIGYVCILSPSSVKEWMIEAINDYHSNQEIKKLNKNALDSVKHLNELY